MENKVKTVLIASGSGTDANAIMKAYNNGEIPNIDLKFLISTNPDAACLQKAADCGIPALAFDRNNLGSSLFNQELKEVLLTRGIKLVFLVGCIVNVPLINGVTFYNIHPANTENCGGNHMYGLEPHKKVLSDISDLIHRGRKTLEDKFYTEPTVHEVNEKYDTGQYLLKLNVEIPKQIIYNLINGLESLEEAASKLQQYVLPYEWMMLPWAVNLAASKILGK